MADTEYKRLIQTAKERATFGFLAVVQRAMQDADKNIAELLIFAKSGPEQTALTSVRHFLRQDGSVFLRRVDHLFRNALDRAMQTMYVDLRPGMRKLSIDELTLMDDEVVSHQIEVGRLTERMREANEESIGRLNVIVAKLHGEHAARERENPFRPYLPARAMYDAIRGIAHDESKVRVLYEHLSNALIQHLPGYYSAVREVFEASGVQGKFVAQRSRAAHNQRYFGAPEQHAGAAQAGVNVMPGLQRVLETLQGMSNGTATTGLASDHGSGATNVQAFLHKMLSSSKSFILSPDGEFSRGRTMPGAPLLPSNPLVAQLQQHQKSAADGQADLAETGRNQLSALRETLDLGTASMVERVTIDVVAMLFEFILGDEQIPALTRKQIARLQIPILKAAVLEPDLMHEEHHPARKLLNRMSTAAIATDPASPGGHKLSIEIERIVDKLLAEFDTDTAIFGTSLQEFERFMVSYLREDDASATQGIEAVEEAEKFSILLTNATNALCEVLLPLNVDKRVSDFIIHVWPHVLVAAAAQDAERKVAADLTESAVQRYRAVLPELLWSIQEKSLDERSALMRLLPDLVKRLRQALQLIQLSDEECKQILDLLVEMHTTVLRGSPNGGLKEYRSLDDLRQQFARLSVNWERVSWALAEPPQPRAAVIEEIFAKRPIAVELNLGVHAVASSLADQEFLVQTYLLGTRVAFPATDGSSRSGQLVWISTHRSLYLFKQDGGSTLMLYTFASLLEALRDETIVPVEYAPVFERAVESLLFGAGSV
jgi:hypothetical protein